MKTAKKWNKLFLVGMLAMVLALSFNSCASLSTHSGSPLLVGGLTSAKVNANRGAPIAKYAIIIGLITTGYPEFLAAIDGKDVDIVYTHYTPFYIKVEAVARN